MGRSEQLNKTGNGITQETEAGGSKQRHAEKYRQWQEFKLQQRNSEHRMLQKKVSLQHELIEANDRLHQQRQEEDEQKKIQLRDTMKKQKALKQQSVMKPCHQTSETVRQKHAAKQTKSDRKINQMMTRKHHEQTHSDQHLPTIDNREQTMADARWDHQHGDMEVEDGTIKEEDEEEDEDFEDKEDHEYQLQKMFGKREANYFLRPRIEPEKKKQIHIPAAVRRKGGRAGATTLWTILRDKTHMKLQKADSQIPEELKDAYGAFVRECLTKNKTVAKRSFYSEDGVPETEKIQDGSYRKKVRELRHNVELMYRSAHNNKDKTAILTYNNPLPDFSDRNGEEGPMRYYPSWIASEEVLDVPAYYKWLDKLPNIEGIVPMENEMHDDIEPRVTDKDPTGLSKNAINLSFLTEADATCQGRFWTGKQENPDDDNEHKIIPLSKRRTEVESKPKIKKATHNRRSLTAPTSRTASDVKAVEPWQPLSLDALTEYKPTVDTLRSEGSFSHGTTNMWKPILAQQSL